MRQSHSSGTFFYQVTAENEGGETSASNEPSATAGGANLSILIDNYNVAGATRFRIYRGVTTGNMQGYMIASGTSFTDDGTVALISGTPPLTNKSGGDHIDYVIIR